jgi:hypothetical protein
MRRRGQAYCRSLACSVLACVRRDLWPSPFSCSFIRSRRVLFGAVCQRFAAGRNVFTGASGRLTGAKKRRGDNQRKQGQCDREAYTHGAYPYGLCPTDVAKFNSAQALRRVSQMVSDLYRLLERKELVTFDV